MAVCSSSVSKSNGVTADTRFQLHKAAFEGDATLIKRLLEDMKLDPNSLDKHGEGCTEGHNNITVLIVSKKY